jgi:uncharacterized protein (TIGR02145 family)
LAPIGWHVATDPEWDTLSTYLGGELIAGGKLKEIGTTHWNTPNIGATNEFGFSALPGGMRYSFGGYNVIGTYGMWWASTGIDTTDSWYWVAYHINSEFGHTNGSINFGFSVRCIRD